MKAFNSPVDIGSPVFKQKKAPYCLKRQKESLKILSSCITPSRVYQIVEYTPILTLYLRVVKVFFLIFGPHLIGGRALSEPSPFPLLQQDHLLDSGELTCSEPIEVNARSQTFSVPNNCFISRVLLFINERCYLLTQNVKYL